MVMEGFVVAERSGFDGYTSRPVADNRDLMVLGAYIARQQMAARMGETAFGTDRSFYQVLGYPRTLEFKDFLQLYERHDVAGRLVDLPAEDTWRKPPRVSEGTDGETEFTKAWDFLVRKRRVFAKLATADKLSGVGRYGVLLIGVRDGGSLDKPIKEGTIKGPKSVLYLRPFHEGDAEIEEWETNSQDERYGLPVMYSVQVRDDDEQNVHWSRVLHLAENKGSNEAYGLPRLQRAYNQFIDKLKLGGGVAEAIWYAMRPGMAITEKEGYDPAGLMDDDTFVEEVKRYMHDPARILRLVGAEITEIAPPRMLDPSGAADVNLGYIASSQAIPKRVLIGSAQGELAAAKEDLRQWYAHVGYRQKSYAEPEILRAFVDRLIWMGALPTPTGGADAYYVGTKDPEGQYRWPTLHELDDLELAEVRENKAVAAKALSDPMGAYPMDDNEKRAMLGLEPREAPMPEPAPEPEVVMKAKQNYREGLISAVALAELIAGDGRVLEALSER